MINVDIGLGFTCIIEKTTMNSDSGRGANTTDESQVSKDCS